MVMAFCCCSYHALGRDEPAVRLTRSDTAKGKRSDTPRHPAEETRPCSATHR